MESGILHLDNCTARVLRPILKDEECRRRIERIKSGCETYYING